MPVTDPSLQSVSIMKYLSACTIKVGVKGESFRGCFSALPIVAKIKFLYEQMAKEILGTYSQNERFSSPKARASNV